MFWKLEISVIENISKLCYICKCYNNVFVLVELERIVVMNFLQIQCFTRLAHNKRMKKTAAEFNIRPSTLTKQIQQLEDELSVELIKNTPDGFALTQFGEMVFPSMQFMAHQYSTMLYDMKKFSENDDRVFKIMLPFHQRDIINALLDFKDITPDVSFELTETTNYVIQDALYNADIDLGFGYSELMEKKLSGAYLTKRDSVVAVVSNDHYLANKESISISDLKDERFYLFRDDALMYRYILTICTMAGFVPKSDDCNYRLKTILWNVSQNYGVSLMTKSSIEVLAPQNCTVLPLKENHYVRMNMYIPTTYPSDICKKLVSFMLERFS